MRPSLDSSDAQPKLTAAGEQAWTEFRYQVEWQDGFALIFLFSSNHAVTNLFYKRLTDICATHVSTVQRIAPYPPEKLAEEVLAAIRTPEEKYVNLLAPIWIEAGRKSDPEWLDGCDLMLARLNEHRDMLRSRTTRPCIISLPGKYRQRAREIAPDLWAVRTFSLDLDDIRPLVESPAVLEEPTRPEFPQPHLSIMQKPYCPNGVVSAVRDNQP